MPGSSIAVEIEEIELEGDYGSTSIPSLSLTCSRCQHTVEVYGTSTASARRGAIMLREQCPYGERNFYDVGDYGGAT